MHGHNNYYLIVQLVNKPAFMFLIALKEKRKKIHNNHTTLQSPCNVWFFIHINQ